METLAAEVPCHLISLGLSKGPSRQPGRGASWCQSDNPTGLRLVFVQRPNAGQQLSTVKMFVFDTARWQEGRWGVEDTRHRCRCHNWQRAHEISVANSFIFQLPKLLRLFQTSKLQSMSSSHNELHLYKGVKRFCVLFEKGEESGVKKKKGNTPYDGKGQELLPDH